MAEKVPKSKVTRASLINAGGYALGQCIDKLQGRYTPKEDRLSYIRAVSSLITSISGVMKDVEMEELEERIRRLEEAVKDTKKS